MNLLKRISRLITANLNNLLDQAEDPEVMVKQLIREMEESIIELRREAVRAVARQKQLEKQLITAEDQTADLEKKATLALEENQEELARKIVAKKLFTQQTCEELQRELEDATKLAEQIKNDLLRLEDQVQAARRKKEELIRRKRAAEAQLRSQQAARKSSEALSAAAGSVAELEAAGKSIQDYEGQIKVLEAEAEASQEILEMEIKKELDLQKLAEEHSIEEELQRLKLAAGHSQEQKSKERS